MNIDLCMFLDDRLNSIEPEQYQDFLIFEKELIELQLIKESGEEFYG
jgi:hypothetical protein